VSRYLIVVAEGGARNGDRLLVQPLVDGKFLVGRALRADIPVPAEESAVGQQHCYLRIEGGAVWLDTLPYQEVYVDAGRSARPPQSIGPRTSVKLLPFDKLSERVIELGGLARNVERSGGPFTGVGRTRLKIKLANSKDTKVATEQGTRALRRRKAALSSGRWLQIVSTAASVLALVGVVGGFAILAPPALAMLTGIKGDTEAINETTQQLSVSLEEMNRKLDRQDGNLSQYYQGLIGSIQEQNRRTVELVSALPEKFAAAGPKYYKDSQGAVWVAGSIDKVSGAFEGVGTAWVLEKAAGPGRRSLITNNHVLGILKARVARGGLPAIRRTGDNNEVLQYPLDPAALADEASSHPDFDPLNRKQQGVRNRVNVFDVARLALADPTRDAELGPGLRIASDGELKALSRQTQVGYIGFPYENLSASGVNVDLPSPVYVRGQISNMNDAFLLNVPDNRWQERQLLIVNAAAMGGASGSPVFNDEGHVIGLVSGGDVLQIDKSVLSDATRASANLNAEQDLFRVPIGFAYVIRSDIVTELVKGERPPGRDEQWTRALNEIDKAGDRAEFTSWKFRNCGESEPEHFSDADKLDASGVYTDGLDKATGKAMYVSAQVTDGAGRLSTLDILLGDEKESAASALPSRLNTQTQTNIRQPGKVKLLLKGTPLAAFTVDRYACDLRSSAGAGR
jgi:hypothetical protein